LTEEREYGLKPYTPLLWELAEKLGRQVAHHRVAIPDMGIPTPEEMVYILDTMDFVLQAGHVVYMHCYAGIGRTGTVIGCHLARHSMSGDEALQEIARLRQGTPAGWKRSPSTSAQRQMVRNWPKGQ
jgi:protein-tyrosine phosphatase